MQRRTFLKVGIFGGALLLVAGSGVVLLGPAGTPARPRRKLRVLDARAFGALVAVAARVVTADGADPVEIAHSVDEYLTFIAPEAGEDVRRALRLLESPVAGLVLDGRPRAFTALASAEQDAALAAWRDSRLVLRRAAYSAIRKLCAGAYYQDPASWPGIGYPGPVEIMA